MQQSQETVGLVIVGASESTLWTYWLLRNVKEYRYAGPVWLVNPNRDSVYSERCYRSIDELPGIPQVAVVITSAPRAVEACEQLVARGTSEIAVISDGFRETGTREGVELEARLAAMLAQQGVRLIGPNCVGFASFHESLCAIAEPIPPGIQPGAVSIVSQSGVLTGTVLATLETEHLGVDVCYSLGNGAALDLAAAISFLNQRDSTQVIAVMAESIGDREQLRAAVAAGKAVGRDFVFLMLGQSEDGRRIAQSHTGAILGDQRVVRRWLESVGVVLVDSLEELGRAAALLLSVGRPSHDRGVFIVTASGGAAGYAADLCGVYGLQLASLSQTTAMRLEEHLLPGTKVGNPLDSTTHGGPASFAAIYELVLNDPAVGMLVDPYGLPWPHDSPEWQIHTGVLQTVADMVVSTGKALIHASMPYQERTDFIQRLSGLPNVSVGIGLPATISALAKLYVHPRIATGEAAPKAAIHDLNADVVDEARARAVLGRIPLPLVRSHLAVSVGDVLAACEGLRPPLVAKLSVRGLGEKGEVGRMHLGLATPADAHSACVEMVEHVAHMSPEIASDVHFLIQEMVHGPELLVALVRDPVGGPCIILGIGGWAAEAGHLFGVLPLPLAEGHLDLDMELERGGLRAILGKRATVDLRDFITALARAAEDEVLSAYSVIECNPVIITASDGAQIADALLVKGGSQ